MQSKLASFLTITLILVVSQICSAGGIYNLTDHSLLIIKEGGIFKVTNGPIYATLKLSGDSPYDHTNIESLTFTPEGESILGYAGKYAGEFDSSGVTLSEDSLGRLMLDDVIDVPLRRFSWVDSDAPRTKLQESSQVLSQSLEINILSTHSSIILKRKVLGGGLTLPGVRLGPSVSGAWIRAVPEPSAIILAFCSTLVCTSCRLRLL